MRKAFTVPVTNPSDPSKPCPLEWQELSFSHAFPLYRFFKDVLHYKGRSLAQEDGQKWVTLPHKTRKNYIAEAKDIMFSLRDFPLGIHQLLPLAAGLALPNLFRCRQKPFDVSEGLLGRYHFGVLRNTESKKILGITTFERTDTLHEAEISCWKHPLLTSTTFRNAASSFMSWSQETCGYKHFLAHIPQKTETQRGNQAAVLASIQSGFNIVDIRPADAPNGNGKDTLVLRAENWAPRALTV